MESKNRMLNIRYFLLQVLFWGAAVVIYAYMTQILEYKGFTEVEIGILSGARLLTGVVFQIWIGAFADGHVYTVPLKKVIAFLSVGSALFTVGLQFVEHNFIIMLVLSMGYGITFTTVSPLIDSMSVLYVNHGQNVNFAKGRMGGSISWALLCVGAGVYCDTRGIGGLPICGAVLCFIMAIIVFTMPWESIKKECCVNKGKDNVEKQVHSVVYLLIQYPVYTVFLIASSLMFMGYNFGSVFLIDIFIGLGGNNTHYGLSEFVLAISEVPSAFIILKYRRKIPMKWFMLCCAIFMTLKNIIPTYSENIYVIIVAQACEMLGFGLYYSGGMYLIADLLPEGDVVKATTLISVATIGIGEGIASVLCGVIRRQFGLYGLMKAGCLVNFLAIFVMLFMCFMKESEKSCHSDSVRL